MSVQTATNRFIVPPLENPVGFYQQLLSGISNYEQLGKNLINLSEQARLLRQMDRVSQYGQVLSNIPIKEYQVIGHYYIGISLSRGTQEELEQARIILEKVASVAPLKYQARAMVALSAISWAKNQPSDTIRYCIEASKIGGFDLTSVQALRGIAVLKGREGFHRSSLCDLENLFPLARYAPTHIYFDYLNSLAVELAECGRLEEAENICKIICSSPLVIVYPEWRDTGEGIALKSYRLSRSTVPVALKPIPSNVLSLPERKIVPTPQDKPASIRSLQEWKDKMVKEPKGNDDVDKMDDKQLLLKIVEVVSDESLTENELRQILNLAIRLSKRT